MINHDAWENASQLAEKHANQNGVFVRLASHGDKVVGAFCGDPFAREVVWSGERYETFDPSLHKDKRPSLRVMLNFYVPAESAMKVIEGGTVWFKDVLKVRDKYGLDKWLFEIERHGESGDPKTTYSVLPEMRIDSVLQALLSQIALNDLAALASGESPELSDDAALAPLGGANGPIAAPVVAQLIERLKALPRSEVEAFLKHFGIGRVREMTARNLAEAMRVLAQLERTHTAPVDPFA